MKIGPNDPCKCGSGTKFKKCCGPRGGLTPIEHAEEQAHREDRARMHRSSPSSALPMIFGFAAMGAFAMAAIDGPGPVPPRPRKRGRRKK